ncbi:hypothetical protein MHBO_002552 [Bonamia ostreae]|uniref:Secreted protein n=1 Tax=Bonamia ostreae TaxID=126728 RepID=A0ABV2AMR2_9EUKA
MRKITFVAVWTTRIIFAKLRFIKFALSVAVSAALVDTDSGIVFGTRTTAETGILAPTRTRANRFDFAFVAQTPFSSLLR